ncbi:MAG: PEP-utilizing enzyme [Dehalococcoidia bacterium]
MNARRVAALPTYNHKLLVTTEHDLWTRANAGEVLPGVITPLSWTFSEDYFDLAFGGGFERMGINLMDRGQFVQLFHGRVYFNYGLMVQGMQELGFPSVDFLSNVGGPGMEGEGLYAESGLSFRRVLRHLPGILKQVRHLNRLHKVFAKQIEELEAEVARLRQIDLETMTDEQLASESEHLAEMIKPRMLLLMDAQSAVFSNLAQVRYFLKRWVGDEELASDLMTGIPGIKTAEANIELWKIARKARGNPRAREIVAAASPESLLPDLEAEGEAHEVVSELRVYLDAYGHRAADELEIKTPRWVERPAPLMAAFRGYVLAGEELNPEGFEQKQRERRLAAERQVKAKLKSGLLAKVLPWKWLVFQQNLRESQKFLPLRENPKFYALKLSLYTRYALLAAARRWRAEGALKNEEDIFLLRNDELLAYARAGIAGRDRGRRDILALLDQRRDEYARYQTLEPLMVLRDSELDTRLEPVAATTAMKENGRGPRVLKGIAASAGVASGRARVITNPHEGQLEAGEVLVAPFTDPGWTPFFPLAAAIVMDLGGMLSHGAVVAREYGIPAVVNTRVATKQIKDGEMVTVDGLAGTVTVAAGEPPQD